MKKLLVFFMLVTTSVFAQVPQGFNYQAALRDGSGAVLSNQPVSVKIELTQGSIVYTEIHSLTTNSVGLINMAIGYTPASGSPAFSAIDWNQGGVELTTSYDPTGGSNWTLVSATELQSVPYALSAANAFSGDFNDLSNVPSLDTSSTNELQTLTINGDTLTLLNGGTVILPLSSKAEEVDDLLDGKSLGTSLGIGTNSLQGLTSSTANNTAVGINSLTSINVGGNNTAFGSEALKNNLGGSQNTAIGQQVMYSNLGGDHNTAVGTQALRANTSGHSNVALGHDALQLNSSGSENTVVGRDALKNATASSGNSVLGYEALLNSNTSYSNDAIGFKSLRSLTAGNSNVAVGRGAMQDLGTNTQSEQHRNTAVGHAALNRFKSGSNNIGIGNEVGAWLTGGMNNVILGGAGAASSDSVRVINDNVILGYNAAGKIANGSNANTVIGRSAMSNFSEGFNNIAIGNNTAGQITKGNSNVFIGGTSSGQLRTLPVYSNVAIGGGTGSHLDSNAYANVFVGENAGNMMRGGSDNTAIGHGALQDARKGGYNVAIGAASMALAGTDISANTAIGAQSLVNTTASENTAVGKGALNQTTSGSQNTGLGAYSLNQNTTGSHNVAVGASALSQNITGQYNVALGTYAINNGQSGEGNTAIGHSTLSNLSTGSSNTAIGVWSMTGWGGQITGQFNQGVGHQSLSHITSGNRNSAMGNSSLFNLRTGSDNSVFGSQAGQNLRSGSGNTFVGALSGSSDTSLTNSTAIGYGAQVKADNTIQLGNSGTVKVSTSGRFEGDGATLSDSSTSGDNAILRLSSNSKGFIYPRLTYNERQSLIPEAGMAVFCLDCGGRGQLQIFDGYAWTGFSGSRALGLNDVGIGDTAFGGVVAYIFQQGDYGYVANEVHGIIVALNDLPNTYTWASGFSSSTQVQQLLSTISTQIGTGKLNSDTIMSLASTSLSFPAVTAAASYQFNGYNDWFLPSSGDLFAVKLALSQSGISNFVTVPVNSSNLSTAYWSSSLMANYVGARAPMFGVGLGECGCAFLESYRVRPVRYF